MKLENQVVCKELSQEMKELGYVQEGLCWWHFDKDTNKWWVSNEWSGSFCVHDENPERYVAPTVAELGEALKPNTLPHYQKDSLLSDGWRCSYNCTTIIKAVETEADARAKMWIYLKKEGLLK